ncbi:MAG: Holliday junction branch migration protein RuvA [Gemmiger sp.]|nr:Holliday junction branch migration protein RuvA [Gemmiger sp.]
MIYSLTGEILKKTLDTVVICCGGVGYLAQVPTTVSGALPAVGGTATLYTFMNVTENDVALYGFATQEQQACFKMLTGVSGVGPKAGLSILSVLSPDKIALAASSGDHKAFTAASGVGPKLAQRLALELKDKVGKGLAAGVGFGAGAGDGAAPAPQSAQAQAVAALVSLGYTASDAAASVNRIDDTLPVQDIIKLALRGLSRV